MRIRILVAALCALGAALALALGGSSVSAQSQPPCDFLTGGGYIFPTGPATGAKATLATAGGCKNGSPPAPYFGHLEYQDKAAGVKVHWTSITGYAIDTTIFPDPNARVICGTATTDQGNVNFVVRAKDAGEPGVNDEFDIQLTGAVTYSTFASGPHKLGGGTGGGGNIQLHKPNNSNTGVFGGSCPPLPGPQMFTLTVAKTGTAAAPADSTVTSNPPGISCGSTCSATFAPGTAVMLTVTTRTGNSTTWTSGCDPGTE